MELKYFTRQGNSYALKPQTGLSLILAVIFVALGIATIMYSTAHNFGYVLIAFAALMIYSKQKRKFVIDANKKVFIVKNNAFHVEKAYPFDTFDGITLHRVKYVGLLTINVSAVAYFIVDGREKRGSLNQALTTGPIQSLINEMNEIFAVCGISSNNQENSTTPVV